MFRNVFIFILFCLFIAHPVLASESTTSVQYNIDGLDNRVTVLEAKASGTVTAINDLNLEIESINVWLSSLESDFGTLSYNFETLSNEWNNFKANIDNLTTVIQALNQYLNTLKALQIPGPGSNLAGKTYAEIVALFPEPPESYEIDLRGANLTAADLTDANLTNANFMGATFVGANLTNANLSGADLKYADLKGVNWSGSTCPDGSNSGEDDGDSNTCLNNLELPSM